MVVKVISVIEAQKQLKAVCEQALGGEIIRLQLADGGLIQLSPVPQTAPAELADAYNDPEWAQFENQCGKSSD